MTDPVQTFAHPADARFSFGIVAPPPSDDAPTPGLVVVVHDSTRNYRPCAEAYIAFARRHHHVVLSPLFPRDVQGDGHVDGYKFMREGALRYDELLHTMIDDAVRRTGCDGSRFFLQGYSGGAQFVHRYLLLHPERLRAVSLGAPGAVTLPDEQVDWWAGVRDVQSLFGKPFDAAGLCQVPIQLVISDADTETWEIREQPASCYWPVEADRLRANRVDRMRVLHRALLGLGAQVELQVLKGLQHGQGPGPAATLAQHFFAEQLKLRI
jgi:pimeloyl-ACP methyl ester carboxylesterase